MPRTSTYLNFPRNTEQAFEFYKTVFDTEYLQPIARFSGVPAHEGAPPLSENDKNLVMHVELPILGGHVLMGTDAPESMGFKINYGDNVHLNLEPDTVAEADKLFAKLSAGGQVSMPLAKMFWGGYFGSCTDKFGIKWMVNVANA